MTRRVVGRYTLFDEIARGGMASVHLARLSAAAGFSRTVVIKRMQPELALDPQFCAMFIDEARVAARVSHPNVAQTLDVISEEGELLLVLEYVHGTSLASAFRACASLGRQIPIAVANAVMVGTLHGLHAAHTAVDEQGEPLCIVHRDVSPQNILIGTDGGARLIDFGVAKAVGRLQTTDAGGLRGKLAYMPREQVVGTVTAVTDLYAAGVVLWESWAGRRFFEAENEAALVLKIMAGERTSPMPFRPELSPELEQFVMKAVASSPEDRFSAADVMASALERIGPIASVTEVGAWVRDTVGDALARRMTMIASIEADTVSRADASMISYRKKALPADGPASEALADAEHTAATVVTASGGEPSPSTLASHSRQIFSLAPSEQTRTRSWGGLGMRAGALVALISVIAMLGSMRWLGSRSASHEYDKSMPVAGAAAVPAAPAPPLAVAFTTATSTEHMQATPALAPSFAPSGDSSVKLLAGRQNNATNAGKSPITAARSRDSAQPPLTHRSASTADAPAQATVPPAPIAARPATAPACDPPYDIDPATGDKRYKRECLRR